MANIKWNTSTVVLTALGALVALLVWQSITEFDAAEGGFKFKLG